MWLTYESLEEKKNQVGKSGKTFDCWILHGTKRGYNDEPDSPYDKTIFDNQTVTVIEKGINRRNQSLLQFIQKACKPGDTLIVRSERDGQFWRWATIENRAAEKPTYEPISDQDAERIREAQGNSAPVIPWD